MLNCKEVTELCSQEMERKLPLMERISLRTHLMMCTGCTNFRKQMSALRHVSRRYAQGEAISTSGNEPPQGG